MTRLDYVKASANLFFTYMKNPDEDTKLRLKNSIQGFYKNNDLTICDDKIEAEIVNNNYINRLVKEFHSHDFADDSFERITMVEIIMMMDEVLEKTT